MSNKNAIGKVGEGFAVTTRNVNSINGANMSGIMSDTHANHSNLSATNPGIKNIMEAKGLGNKAKAMGQNLKDGVKENIELDRQYRERVQSQEDYRILLEKQREDRQATINGTKYGRGKLERPVVVNSEDVQIIVPVMHPSIVQADY